MKRGHIILVAAVIILGGAWVAYHGYVGGTGDTTLSGQDQTVRDVPSNQPGLREQPEALPNNSR